ncbi:MAG: DUF2807 domain-containing protein [Methylococcaceae bacterium]|nr:DUF2807 domain-containing protein [Methylococcaceae bacterium]
MNHQIEKPECNQLNPIQQIGVWLLLTLACVSLPVASQSYTGKNVIDGVVYGENNSDMLKGSGVMGKDKRQIDDFQSIKIEGSINVNYRRGQNTQCAVTGDNNLLPIIKTEVSHGVLVISANKNYQAQLPLIVELIGPNLKALIQDGASDVDLRELNEKSFKLNMSGSGTVNAQGKAGEFLAEISGSGDVKARNLIADQADLSITGSASIEVAAKNLLKASITGSGDITYFGNPKKVEPRITGSGNIDAGD